MTNKFTPAPWKLTADDDYIWVESKTDIIARMRIIHSMEQEANANLIAAAPDMYEALEEAREFIPQNALRDKIDSLLYKISRI